MLKATYLRMNGNSPRLLALPSFSIHTSLAVQCHDTDHTEVPAVKDGCH